VPVTINTITLAFSDPGIERGFVNNRMPRTVVNFRMLIVLGLLLCITSLIVSEFWEVGRYPTEEDYRTRTLMTNVVAGIVVWGIILMAVSFVPGLFRGANFVALEVFMATSAVLPLVAHTFALPWYAARALGVEPAVLGESFGSLTDTRHVLAIDLVVTATHLALPVRPYALAIVQVASFLCYVVPTWAVGGPEMEDAPFTMIFLLCLIGAAGWGKRSMEFQERVQFLTLIRERSLRFQSEFALSQHQLGKNQQQGVSAPSEPSEAGKESLPSTTESGRVFCRSRPDISKDLIDEMAAIGAREQWLVAAGELEIEAARVLGAGSFGVVFSGCYQGTPVAVKMRKTRSGLNSPAQLLQLCNELRILRRLRHPNIVFLYGACLDTNHGDLALVLELVDGVQLRHFIWSGSSPDSGRASPVDQRGPSDAARSQVLLDMSCALRYLHTRTPRIVHGDLKDTNVLVEPSRAPCSHRAKLLDFGLARVCTRHARVLGGTLRWLAPELVGSHVRAPNSSADVFSFGRLVFFVLTGRFPIENVSRSKLRQFLKSAELPELQWGHAGRDAAAYRPLVEECTQVDPSVRPRMTQVHARLAVLHGGEGSARLGDGDRAAPAVDLADSAAMLQRMRGIISTPTHKVAAAAASACSVPMPPSAAADFAEESSSQRSKHLSPVPEDGFNNGGIGTTQSPEADSSQPLALPAFQRTPRKTQLLMLIDVIMHCNIEMPPGACCFFHAGARQLKVVCDELEGRACLDMRDRGVSGQCKECGALGREDPAASRSASYLDVVRECFFCGGVVELCNNASTGNSCDSI